MTTSLLIAIGGFVAVLLVVGALQRRGTAHQDEQVARQLEEARRRGSYKPLAQHPLIDASRCVGCGTCVEACPEEGVLGLRHGQAVIIHGARCVGHGLCGEACPVGALQVGLGALAERKEIPRLSEELESSVAGVFIAGELGGLSLIRNAVDQGVRVVRTVAARLQGSADLQGDAAELDCDLAIVGCGPAGLGASLAARELDLRAITIEQEEDLGGSILHYPRRKLTMLQSFKLPYHGKVKAGEMHKEEILELFEGLIEKARPPIRFGERLEQFGVRAQGAGFTLTTARGRLQARFVLLALGRRGTPRKLGVPGEGLSKVAYRLVDAASYEHARLLVVGGGDSAVEAALGLAEQRGNEVYLSYRKPALFRIKARNEERIGRAIKAGRVRTLFSSTVREIRPSEVCLDVCAEDGSVRQELLANDYTFVFAGGMPPFAVLEKSGVAMGGPTPAGEVAAAAAGARGATLSGDRR